MAIVGILALFIGFILVISRPISKRKNARCTARVQGTLVETYLRDDFESSIHSVHVYSYRVDGIDYELKTDDHSPQVQKVGDGCTIWYNPAKPKDAQAFRPSDEYLKTLTNIGIAILLAGLLLVCVSLAL